MGLAMGFSEQEFLTVWGLFLINRRGILLLLFSVLCEKLHLRSQINQTIMPSIGLTKVQEALPTAELSRKKAKSQLLNPISQT